MIGTVSDPKIFNELTTRRGFKCKLKENLSSGTPVSIQTVVE